MRFSILGPVRVRNSTADPDPDGRQQRLLLALFLAGAGSVFGLSELVDVIWATRRAGEVNNVHRAGDL